MNILGEYDNGNYHVTLYRDGTKVRENDLPFFEASFPECIDIKITDYCDQGCTYCHENSTVHGKHGDLFVSFIRTLQPFTELAIGGGNPLSHPNLEEFLIVLKERNIVANLTVNQNHFMQYASTIRQFIANNYIKGLGISLTDSKDEKFYALIKDLRNVVIHTINGITTAEDYRQMFGRNLKILILGYKNIRRGQIHKAVYSETVGANQRELQHLLPSMFNKFNVISFDNLALDQLEVKRMVSKFVWEESYMGDDGQFTMYVDLVNREFASSSTSSIRYDLLDNIDDMFRMVQNEVEICYRNK